MRQQIRRHCDGLSFPSAMPSKYFFQAGSGRYGLIGMHVESTASQAPSSSREKIPEEHIQEFYKKHIEETKRDLIENLLKTQPRAFEKIVLDLLLKMGYGTNGSVRQSKNGPDGGIDGEILQDRLGFDRIYMQAKRYAPQKAISESKVRDFVGALKGGTRGVFITTSRFTKRAVEFSEEQQQKNLVLIDGDRLAQLMIEHELGVQETHVFSTYRLDSELFGEVEG
ncbi:restriction endonuclease [Pseudomonas aeruginosa]|nr:restriction endonuclease [Pseudomonas aeruginosa]